MASSMLELMDELYQGSSEAYDQLSRCLTFQIDLDNKPLSDQFTQQMIGDFYDQARSGNAHAMAMLGEIYLNGWSIPKDISKALNYARHAASLGQGNGEVLLGFLYANGLGVAKNYDRAMQWFKSALEKNRSMAANNIGVMYEQGLGVKKDLSLAIKYYQQAAEQKNNLAINNLERLTGQKV